MRRSFATEAGGRCVVMVARSSGGSWRRGEGGAVVVVVVWGGGVGWVSLWLRGAERGGGAEVVIFLFDGFVGGLDGGGLLCVVLWGCFC